MGPDFFISYAGPDVDWARWIADELERSGFTTTYQEKDFGPGVDFVHEMHRAAVASQRTIAVLSPDYLASDFGEAEWRAAFGRDPTGEKRLLIPVRVRPCEPPGLLHTRVYVDLVDRDEVAGRAALLAAVDLNRPRPSKAPFPGDRRARFPGSVQPPSTAPDRPTAGRTRGYAKAYRSWMLRRTRLPQPSRALPTVGSAVPDLDAVFVDVSVVPRPQRDVRGGLLDDAPAAVADRHSIWRFLNERDPQALVLLGAPGSGKSTLLRHVVRGVADRSWVMHRRRTPILLEWRSHAHLVVADPAKKLPVIAAALPDHLAVPEPDGWWETKLSQGRCVVLLDGLDEVTAFGERKIVTDWIRRQIEYFPDNHFVLSSRPYGYERLRLDEMRTLQVRPFTRQQVVTFVRKWYVAETGGSGSRRESRAKAATGAADLNERLLATPALHDLMVNPLLLTMIANVHLYGGTLPRSRSRLYEELFEVLLSPRRESGPEDARLRARVLQERLAAVAFRFMTAGAVILPRDELTAALGPGADAVIRDARENGVLLELDDRTYSFAHLTFQEYLAAEHIRRHNLIDVLIEGVDTNWWREVTLLWAAAQSADEIIRACLESGRIGALSLAFECADLDQAVDPGLRERLQALLDDAFRPGADQERRRMAAGVEALRYLRRTVATAGGSRLCVGPVPGRLFWLFVQDGHPSPDRPSRPDTVPARGMWGRDALDFVEWINKITADGGDPDTRYRLPTYAELTELADGVDDAAQVLRSASPIAWVAGEASVLPRLWTLPGRRLPATVTGAELATGLAGAADHSNLLLDLVSLGVRSRAVLLGLLIDHLANRATSRRNVLDVQAAQPHTSRRIVVDHSSRTEDGRSRQYFENFPSRNPFQVDAEAARRIESGVGEVRSAVLKLVAVVMFERDIGGTSSFAEVREAVMGDYVLSALHQRCQRFSEEADRLARVSVTSYRDRVVQQQGVEALLGDARSIVAKVVRSTGSFRSVPTVGDRPWTTSAARIDERGLVRVEDQLTEVHELLAGVIGPTMAGIWREVVAERRPAEYARTFATLLRAIGAAAGLSDAYRVQVPLDLIREQMIPMTEPTSELPGTLAPLVDLLRDLLAKVFARSGPATDIVEETRMAAALLAVADPGNRNYLLIAAATIAMERRWAGDAPETIYLASM